MCFRQKLTTIESETFKVTQQAKSVADIVITIFKNKVNQASESDLAKKAGIFLKLLYVLKVHITIVVYIKLGQLSGTIGKTVIESGTKLGQSGPVKSFSNTAEAISAQIESEQSLNSQVNVFFFAFLRIFV